MYKLIAIAGTFDRLHKGHRYFISCAFKLGHKVLIGLTSDNYVKEKSKIKNPASPAGRQKSKIHIKYQKYEDRKKELEKFLREERLLGWAKIVKIDDVYGPTTSDTNIEALVVTAETLKGARLVNKRRKELSLKPLKILKVPLILAEDKKCIASTRIRIGEIDRLGKLFVSRITYHVSRINEELRQELKKPLGRLVKGDPRNLNYAAEELKEIIAITQPVLIITVGDEVTKVGNETGIAMNLAIVDFRVHREVKYHSLSELGFVSRSSKAVKTPRMVAGKRVSAHHDSSEVEGTVIHVINPPGHITNELVNAVKNAYLGIIKDAKQRIIQVDGEEDLAGVPAVLLAPLGSWVLYGQPGEGVVVVEVTEDKKNELLSLINKNL